MRVAINGFGRIGRMVFRIAMKKKINVVAINDVHGLDDALYLMKHDSVHGGFNGKLSLKRGKLVVNGKSVIVLGERDPEKLPWKKLNVDLVIESTGAFHKREDFMKHISSGAKRVIVTAPTEDADITIVPGVNNKSLKSSHKIISAASCTTNCSATVAKVINDKLGIKSAMLSTVHGYTSSQNLLDSSNERDPRRGRSAAINLVPTTTGASTAVERVIPSLKGKLRGSALRAPVPDGSIIDFVVELKKKASPERINEILKKSSQKEMKGIIQYSTDYLVSTDIIGNPYSAIIDSRMTQAEGNLAKIFAWYDNEFGYSNRVVDLIKILGKK